MAPAMAEGSELETRIQAMLDPARNRRPLSARSIAAIAATLIALLVPTATVTVHAQAPQSRQTAQGALAGVVEDPSGARVPGCSVVAKNQDGTNQETTTTNAAGQYRFDGIPAGRYVLEFAARGFAMASVPAAVDANGAGRVDAHLRLGEMKETLTVAGRKPSTVASSIAPAPGPIRVGGRVEAAKLVFHMDPIYLMELQQAGVEGTVVIQAVISKEGLVTEVRVQNSGVDSRLVKQASDAVAQWRYQPARLNNQPVATTTTITVGFTLN
jgi:TonB family protein